MEESARKRRRVSAEPREPASPTADASPRRSPSSDSPARSIDIAAASRSALGVVRSAQQLFGPRAVQQSTLGARDRPVTDDPAQRERHSAQSPGAAASLSAAAAAANARPAAPTRRTPARPSPRPLPPPAPDGDDELQPFLRRMQRPSTITGIAIPPPPEPELPPAVSDPVSSTPPRGIHSSPRWRDRLKQKSSPGKGSPLKPRTDGAQRRSAGGGRPLRDLALNASTSAARMVPALHGNAGRLKERDRLRRELMVLRKEIELAAQENERIRATLRAGRQGTPANEDDVLNLVQKTLVSTGTAPTSELSQQMTQAALNPMGILPFGPSNLVPEAEDAGSDPKDIKSHHPVQMSAEDELPFLQLFSPFSATSQVTVLPAVPNRPIRQRRQITLRSRDIPGLFAAKIDMVVNAMNLNILALKVPAMDPCAKPELGAFVDKICSGDCNRTMHHNVGILTWAMGEWYRLATRRARFWLQLKQTLAAKGDFLESVSRLRTQPEQPDDDGHEEEDESASLCDKADLLMFLGLQSYDIPISFAPEVGPEAAVRLEWKIDLDWTGEARSKMAFFLGVPGKWRQADDRGILAKFPKLFEDLLDGGQHPRKAVQTIVALLAGA